MLNLDAQQRARDALRQLDQALAADNATVEEVQKQATNFRDNLFAAFQFLEGEAMALQELQLQVKREGKQQLLIQPRGRPSFLLVLDAEPAYDSRPQGQTAEGAPQSSTELATRLFVVLSAPYRGMLRYYTIFADGTWKRTTFSASGEQVQARNAMVPRSSPDVLVLEAVDLLRYVCTLHPAWDSLIADAETLTLDAVLDRYRVKIHLTGLAAPRTR